MIFSVAYLYRLLRGLLYSHISSSCIIFSRSLLQYIQRCVLGPLHLSNIVMIQWSRYNTIVIYWVGDNGRTVNTSTNPHISDQLGTENAGLTLLCWFIIMIWVLVCKNMYRYECYLTHFESFYRNPETVSVAGKWVDTDLIENRFFIEIQR